ncbi:MAG: hypothetical protein JJLCMIEE_02622 [Acidimicrobiales bacterium]|nr:MAG: Flp pilus assembly protein CpaB [Actinomycetota bacterium]MBV6509529.1 hypothetical protein [Acidimicrobiales bacterium]RIK06600.1 MAG: Flp pilus assembly protein CpaB [Acidobacteriota bacterium]
MSSRRTLILIGAIAVGAVAAFLIFRYISGIEDRALGDNELEMVVVVEGGDVEAGVSADEAIQQERLVVGERRRVDIPSGAIRSLDELSGQVAAVNLPEGTIVSSALFVDENQLGVSRARSLDEGNVAVSVSVDQVRGVANLLQPGDLVDIMVKLEVSETATPAGDGDVAAPTPTPADIGTFDQPAVYLYRKVEVFAVGQSLGTTTVDEEGNEVQTPGSGLITFQVPPEAAQVIASAPSGSLYLTLVPDDYEPGVVDPVLGFEVTGASGGPFPGALGQTPYPQAVESQEEEGGGS